MTDSLIERLASKSNVGADTFNSGPKVPTVKLDGSGAGDTAGSILMFENDEMVNLGNSLVLQIIRVRKKLMLGGENTKFFSEEYDSSANDKVTLKRCSRENEGTPWSKPEVVATGTPNDIRATNPVKVVSVVYGIMNGDKLVKLTVKGSSTTGDDGFYSYADTFKGGTHMFQFETDVSVSKVQKNRAISFHRMHFTRGAEIKKGFELVEKYLDMINGTQTATVAPSTNADEDIDGF